MTEERAMRQRIFAVLASLLAIGLTGCGGLLTEDVAQKDQIILVVPESVLEAPGTWTTLEK